MLLFQHEPNMTRLIDLNGPKWADSHSKMNHKINVMKKLSCQAPIFRCRDLHFANVLLCSKAPARSGNWEVGRMGNLNLA